MTSKIPDGGLYLSLVRKHVKIRYVITSEVDGRILGGGVEAEWHLGEVVYPGSDGFVELWPDEIQ